PLVFEPGKALNLMDAVIQSYFAGHLHLRSRVVVRQPVHGFRILVEFWVVSDAIQSPVRHWHIARNLDKPGYVHGVGLAADKLTLGRREGFEIPPFLRVIVGRKEAFLIWVLHRVLKPELIPGGPI